MGILDGLNPEQRDAVGHVEGPMLVVAGAGTGKTQVITKRIAYLISESKARPSEVLALTFTEKAAREMEDRLYQLIGWQSFQVPIMTFHAFGTELLGRFASHVGRSIRGGLLNDTQKVLLLDQCFDRMKLKYYGPQDDRLEFLEGIIGYIGQLQNKGIDAETYLEYVQELRKNPQDTQHPSDIDEQEDLANLYSLYEAAKAETGTFDYNDQLELPLRILKSRPNLAQRLAQEYRFVLVDEYQDTNSVQDALLRSFIGAEGNIFAVGDDDQAIYGFRGADVANILSFSQHFRVKRSVALVRNYRSGQAILDASYRLIQHNNPERLEAKLGISKRLIAQTPDAGEIVFNQYADSQHELTAVAQDIEGRLNNGVPAGSIAVLAATHAPLKNLARVLRRMSTPYCMSTSLDIFEQPELIGLWYLLKWLCMQADGESIGHVVMGPIIGWTPEEYRRISDTASEAMVSIEDALRQDTTPRSEELVARLDGWRAWAAEANASHLVFKLVFETGLAEKWRQLADAKPRMIRVFEDLQRWLNQIQDFESVAENTSIGRYLAVFPKPPAIEVAEPAGDEGGVQLLTAHSSKGLEFDTVYLINCTQRTWSQSSRPARRVPDELCQEDTLSSEHEFRRLMYVAVTRAKRSLLVSSPAAGPSGAKLPLSLFVTELLGELLVHDQPKRDTSLPGAPLQPYYPLAGPEAQARSLPFERPDGWLELSVTQLSQYEYCPFEFYLSSVLQIKQPLGPQVNFGNIVHKVIEHYNKSILAGSPVPEKELHDLLDLLWTERGYRQKAIAEQDYKLAHETISSFVSRAGSAAGRIMASERAIMLSLPEAKLRINGKMDAVFMREGGPEIRDYKTGRTKTDAEKLSRTAKSNLQLRTYALAYEHDHGAAPDTVVLDYVVTGVEGVATLTPLILRKHREKLGAMADSIRKREFSPEPSPGHNCAAIKYYGTGEQEELAELRLAGIKE